MRGGLNNENLSIHVRGARAYSRRASFGLRLGAGVIDGSLVLALCFLAHRWLRLPPVPEPYWVAVVIFALGAWWASQRSVLGATLGDLAWKLRSEHKGISEELLAPSRLSASEILGAVSLTLLSTCVCAWSIDQAIFRQPIWAKAETLELDAYLPDMSAGQWGILPFYFSLGAWPKAYGGKPVFYSLPYEKGPPTRFAGHIIARWDEPSTRVTFEGPKTPQAPVSAAPGERTPREKIRQCLLGENHSWSCLKIRDATLMRHLNDMQQRLAGKSGGNVALKMTWKLRWFLVRNPAISPSEQAQGIYLSTEDEGRGEERFVLITENGTHQAVMLDYPHPGSPDAVTARKTFEQAIRSLRASDELAPGRAWVDRQLEGVQLTQAPADTPDAVAKLAEIQSLLIAKVSVQPSVFESYFHLGGTALMLSHLARASTHSGSLAGLELSAVAKPLIQSAYRYAQDIAPGDPRTTQLQGFWLEAQKP
jgi:hypothetical protein